MTYLEQNQRSGRIILPDVVRAFALIGIALVNVAYFAHPLGNYNALGAVNAPPDQAAYFGVNALFFMKSYTLFSFMFGAGFAYQMNFAAKHGGRFSARYWRRILGLLILGIFHAAFLFQGDILFAYGLLGAVLYLFRNAKTVTLRRWAIGLYLTQILIIGALALAMWAVKIYAPDMMTELFAEFADEDAAAMAVFGSGDFAAATQQRLMEWSDYVMFGLLIQGFGVLSFFLFGFAAVKSGLLNDAAAPVWKRFRRTFLPFGVAGSILGAYIMTQSINGKDAIMMIGLAITTLFAPLSTAGYLGLIAKWASGPITDLKVFLARGGTSTLTAYLMQSLIMSFIFNHYGLGYFGHIGAAGCTFIALATACVTITFASLWRTKFKRGPIEYLLRIWTYWGRD